MHPVSTPQSPGTAKAYNRLKLSLGILSSLLTFLLPVALIVEGWSTPLAAWARSILPGTHGALVVFLLAVAALQNAIGRVKSMGLLYDRLYRSDDLNAMSLRKYLPPLIDEIMSVFPDRYRIDLDIDVADMSIDVQKLSCLGMIINELVFNAMKYAFIGRETGTITVDAFRTGDRATIIFADDGCGIPDSVNIKSPESFGLRLVVGLTAQMGGKLSLRVEGGTRYTLEFDIP